MKKIILMIGILLCSAPLWALTTLGGSTGLITMPTAEALKYRELNIGFDYTRTGDKDQSLYKVNVGALKNMELGFVGGSYPEEGVFINGKYYLTDSERFPVQLACGFQNLTAKAESQMYLVASKLFQGFSLHGGARADFATDGIAVLLMVGGEYFLNTQTSLMAECIGVKQTFQVNVGIGWEITPILALKASALDIGNEKNAVPLSVGLVLSKFL